MSAFRVIADGKWIACDDGDTWPTPMDGNPDDGGLEVTRCINNPCGDVTLDVPRHYG